VIYGGLKFSNIDVSFLFFVLFGVGIILLYLFVVFTDFEALDCLSFPVFCDWLVFDIFTLFGCNSLLLFWDGVVLNVFALFGGCSLWTFWDWLVFKVFTLFGCWLVLIFWDWLVFNVFTLFCCWLLLIFWDWLVFKVFTLFGCWLLLIFWEGLVFCDFTITGWFVVLTFLGDLNSVMGVFLYLLYFLRIYSICLLYIFDIFVEFKFPCWFVLFLSEGCFTSLRLVILAGAGLFLWSVFLITTGLYIWKWSLLIFCPGLLYSWIVTGLTCLPDTFWKSVSGRTQSHMLYAFGCQHKYY